MEPESRDMQKPIRVAVVGCGAITRQMHMPVLAGHEGIDLVALVDRNVERASELADAYGVRTVLGDAAELNSQMVDAVILATPPCHHAPGTIDLLKRGMHVLVEKPMAICTKDAQEMVRVAEETGNVLTVGVFRRLLPSIRMLKSLLGSNWLGKPQKFVAEGGGMYNWEAATLANMTKELAGGGALIDFGSHILDLLFFLFDEPAEVIEYRDNSLGGVEADCSLRLRFAHQGEPIEGSVELARTRDVGNLIRVECEKGTLEFQVSDRYQVSVTPSDLELADPITGKPRPFQLQTTWADEAEEESWFATFRLQIDDWLRAIRSSQPAQLSGSSSLPTVKLIEQCYDNPQPMNEPWVQAGFEKSRKVSGGGRRKRVLVTGATGFIGSRVAEILSLRDDCEVRAVAHNPGNASRLARLPVEMVQADLRSKDQIAQLVEGCDAVMHCAIGTAWGNRRDIFAVTVDGTRRLAEAALAAGVGRFIHMSTIAVHDENKPGTVDESTPLEPGKGNDYAESKVESEKVIAQVVAKGLSAAIIRPARVYGPFSRIFITRPVQALVEGRFRWIGSPDVPCDMVYVDNLIEAMICAMEAPDEAVKGGQIFAIGEGEDVSWQDFYGYFADALGVGLPAAEGNELTDPAACGASGGLLGFPGACCRGLKEIIKSTEFRGFGRRVLQTDPYGSLPRWALERFPGFRRKVLETVGATEFETYIKSDAPSEEDFVQMGSAGGLVSIEKARRVLGYNPIIPRQRAMELTLDWIRHARLA